MIKLVVFDLDNVIINGEGIDEIGKIANVENEIAEITEKAMNGDIDFETSIQERVKLLEGVSVDEIKKLSEELPLNEGAEETIKGLKDKGLEVAIISGSFDLIAENVKDKLGIDYVFTNQLREEDGKLTGEVTGPLVSASKLDVLKELLEDKDYTLENCVAVGDGANDISMIEGAACGIAFNAKPKVKEIADVVIEGNDLTSILAEVDKLESSEEEAEESEETTEEESSETEETEAPAETEETTEEESSETEEAEEEKTEDSEENQDESASNKESKRSKRKKLPEPVDFVLADTIEGVREQKEEKEALITQISDEREAFNREAKEQRKIRDELNLELKENLQKAIDFRNHRNEINKKVEEYKKKRNEVNGKIRNLERSSGKQNKEKIEQEIKQIDKIIETRVLDIKKENQLVKNANDLRKKLTEVEEDNKVQEEANEFKDESEQYHQKVVEYSAEAQEAHENMIKYFRKTDEIRTAADEAHKAFVEARKNATAKHEDFKMVLSEIHVINKRLGRDRPRRPKRNKPNAPAGQKNAKEEEKAKEIFEKFKNGKKLSTEELLLLQKYNIN